MGSSRNLHFSDEYSSIHLKGKDQHQRHSKILHPSEEPCFTSCVVTLKPLEFAIAVVSIPCSSDVVYETDFLSCVKSFHAPFLITDKLCYYCVGGIEMKELEENGENINVVVEGKKDNHQPLYDPAPLQWFKVTYSTTMQALFITEKEIWSYYDMLP